MPITDHVDHPPIRLSVSPIVHTPPHDLPLSPTPHPHLHPASPSSDDSLPAKSSDATHTSTSTASEKILQTPTSSLVSANHDAHNVPDYRLFSCLFSSYDLSDSGVESRLYAAIFTLGESRAEEPYNNALASILGDRFTRASRAQGQGKIWIFSNFDLGRFKARDADKKYERCEIQEGIRRLREQAGDLSVTSFGES